MAFIIT